jgi:hypothetical protein
LPSTDIDGSAIVILSFEEAKLIKAILEDLPNYNILYETILKKIRDVEEFEQKRDKTGRKWFEGGLL